MSLGIVFYQFQVMLAADVTDVVGIGTSAVEMHYHYRLGARCYGLFYQRIVNLQSVEARFHEHRLQTILRYGEDGCHKGVGRHYHFVAVIHHSHFFVCTEYQRQRVESVAAAYGVTGADISGIVVFKPFSLLAVQIPSASHHAGNCLLYLVSMLGCYVF